MNIQEGTIMHVEVFQTLPLSFFATVQCNGTSDKRSLFCSEKTFNQDLGPECPYPREKIFVDLDDCVEGSYSVYRRRPNEWADLEEFLS